MASPPVPLVRLVWLRRDSHEGHFVIDVETDSLAGVAN